MKLALKLIAILNFYLFPALNLYSQIDTLGDFFPSKIGTTWIYRLHPDWPPIEYERLTITGDSISITDNSRFLFINSGAKPRYKIDTSLNVFENPLDSLGFFANQLILKQKANRLEAWAMSESLIDGAKRVARIKETGFDILFGKIVKYKQVEIGYAVGDSFGLSPISNFYATGFGHYFTIIEPPSTERILIGFIFAGDTLGTVLRMRNEQKAISLYSLSQNYPNPFNPTTSISFSIPSKAFVSLKVMDLLGREIAILASDVFPEGNHTVYWSAPNIPSGVYLYRLQAGSFAQTKRLVFLK